MCEIYFGTIFSNDGIEEIIVKLPADVERGRYSLDRRGTVYVDNTCSRLLNVVDK